MPIDFLLEKESVTQHTLPTFAKEITIGVAFMHIARLQKGYFRKNYADYKSSADLLENMKYGIAYEHAAVLHGTVPSISLLNQGVQTICETSGHGARSLQSC